MQTLSNMRRNSTHHRTLTPYILFVVAIVYESLASMSLFMTPLLGVAFYYIVQHIYDENRYYHLLLILLYSLFMEIDRGLVPLSFLFFTLIFYKFLFRSFKEYIHCQSCLVFSYVIFGYLGYFLFNLFITYLLNMPLVHFSNYYFLYMLTDILIVMVLL